MISEVPIKIDNFNEKDKTVEINGNVVDWDNVIKYALKLVKNI